MKKITAIKKSKKISNFLEIEVFKDFFLKEEDTQYNERVIDKYRFHFKTFKSKFPYLMIKNTVKINYSDKYNHKTVFNSSDFTAEEIKEEYKKLLERVSLKEKYFFTYNYNSNFIYLIKSKEGKSFEELKYLNYNLNYFDNCLIEIIEKVELI